MTQRVFPIKTATACQLKWTWSSVYLNTLTTASCCVANHHKFDLDSFNFHNTSQKIEDRKYMLSGQWPRRGCEVCQKQEHVGNISDRTMFNDWPGYRAPKELDTDPMSTTVTPRILQLYFSNICNLKCVYCSASFSSKINQENLKFGPFEQNGVHIPGWRDMDEESDLAAKKMFEWLDHNLQELDELHLLGGEPLVQKQFHELVDFIRNKNATELSITIQSNFMIEHEKFCQLVDTLSKIKCKKVFLTASIDCWGPQAEYIRHGLDLAVFEKNFEYALAHTDFTLQIHSTLSALTIPSMPALANKINQWNKQRLVYWGVKPTGGLDFLNHTLFGPDLLHMGLEQTINIFETHNDPEHLQFMSYIKNIAREINSSSPNQNHQLKLKTYLKELDRRRNTDYESVFPDIAKRLKNI